MAVAGEAVVGPWKKLLEVSLRRNDRIRHARYFQIATVRPDGRPSNRTVVYRGFLWDTDKLTFVTDKRSNKVHHLRVTDWAEVVWYFPETREQYRIHGHVSVITNDVEDEKLKRARISAWKNMSDPGRQQFLWPYPGGAREEGDESLFHTAAPQKDDPVADDFSLCILDVTDVDHLCLKTNKRYMYTKVDDGRWESRYVNP